MQITSGKVKPAYLWTIKVLAAGEDSENTNIAINCFTCARRGHTTYVVYRRKMLDCLGKNKRRPRMGTTKTLTLPRWK